MWNRHLIMKRSRPFRRWGTRSSPSTILIWTSARGNTSGSWTATILSAGMLRQAIAGGTGWRRGFRDTSGYLYRIPVALVSDSSPYTWLRKPYVCTSSARRDAMNKKILGAVLGLSVLMVSAAAYAHVDVAVGIGVPGYYAPAPVYVAPPPVVVGYGYGGYGGYRDEGRREREWRHREWRHEAWRENHERDRRGYGY